MFITSAWASAPSPEYAASPYSGIWFFLLFFALMYFLIIRPQRTQAKKRQEMLNSITRGDRVITAGGVLGKVVKIHTESAELEIEIDKDVVIRVLRDTISNIQSKSQPLEAEKTNSAKTKVEKEDVGTLNSETEQKDKQ